MSLNNINLSPSMVADLYQKSLIEISDNAILANTTSISSTSQLNKGSEAIKTPEMEWSYLGENKKKILILVNYSDAKHITDEDLEIVTKIFTALKMTIADLAIFNIHDLKNETYKELISFFSPNHVLLFGVEPTQIDLPISFPHFQLQSFNGVSFLFSPNLEQVKNDELLKTKLWVSLQRIFKK